jgi:hypothetical protein
MAKRTTLVMVLLVALFAPLTVRAGGESVESAVVTVLSADPALANAAVVGLRARGPEGLRVLLDAYAAEIDWVRQGGAQPQNWGQLSAAIDRVAGQRDAYSSGLYWYTDLDAAKRAAVATQRPILSLRLLGRLDEELSCANSRFFRTALYANAEVSAYLRDHFVLHWSTERPAPKITIDYGDGRTIVRTITGNSIHYVLDERGRPVDALPGLYGPRRFVGQLAIAEAEAREVARLDGTDRVDRLRRYLRARMESATSEWSSSVGLARLANPRGLAPKPKSTKPTDRAASSAASAGRLAITKSVVEISSLRALDLETDPAKRPYDDPIWASIAAERLDESKLDASSIRMMQRHIPVEIRGDEMLFQVMLDRFERSIAVDTLRNEVVLRPQILAWLVTNGGNEDLDALNAWVYESVFLTSRSDSWLGLQPPDVYTAIEDGGVTHP